MKIAIISDIHDNLERWKEVAQIIKGKKIDTGICCGDVTSIETLIKISETFKKLYLVFGNADYSMIDKTGLIPDNIIYFNEEKKNIHSHYNEFWMNSIGRVTLDNKKIIFTHTKFLTYEIAKEEKPDIFFYGHTHTPWEEKIEETIILNPGEICGRQGRPTFAIFDTKDMKAELILLK